ncbi:septum formation family protein [Promicromonospora sukumoe]|uniref:septum formation family protein n=1 Tax=Promicromonospora sukumoe TaxID=88382 RepID=UPI000368A909|nr:septum formation family protein [Promicromonospora sukumoe]
MSDQLPPLTPPGPPGPPGPGPAPDPYAPARSPYDAPTSYQPLPRPPAEPSTGAGWSIVALLAWWPFGVAAYPHTQRATAALGAGDRQTFAAEGAKARRIGIAGLVFYIALTCLLTVGGLAGVVALGFWFEDVEIAADAATSTRYVDDDQPGSGPIDGTSVRELSEGSCYLTDGLTDVVRTVEVVRCAEPHGGELYRLTHVPSDAFGQTDGVTEPAFPGPAVMARYADETCRAAFESATGTTAEDSGLHFWHTAPDPWDWRALDRQLSCFAESDADDLTARVSER